MRQIVEITIYQDDEQLAQGQVTNASTVNDLYTIANIWTDKPWNRITITNTQVNFKGLKNGQRL